MIEAVITIISCDRCPAIVCLKTDEDYAKFDAEWFDGLVYSFCPQCRIRLSPPSAATMDDGEEAIQNIDLDGVFESYGKTRTEDYAVEKVMDVVKILNALEGRNFEPVTIERIIERAGIVAGRGCRLKPDAVRRILITLELCGWVTRIGKSHYTIGRSFIRLALIILQDAESAKTSDF